ncbi:MAG TPA: RIP metalloprotease RseP [Ignavibacteriaceae bacterium]|jgi:regulator of sigma E protease|nr:RIP metalloprotease RseP [Ignavibacteriaceae bacterium]
MDYIIYFAITIGILVFIHELGHFLAAKACGMRADVFAIGFGKRLFGYNKKTGFTFGNLPKDFDGEGNTDYRLSLLPLGGYVKIAGMVDESFDTEFAKKEPQPYEFRSKNFWQKSFVITAGVLMNLLLAVLIFWGANFFKGKPVTLTTTVGYVKTDSPAEAIGFIKGDVIQSINGVAVENWDEIRNEIYINTIGEDLNVKVLRSGVEENIFVSRKLIPDIEKQGELISPDGFRPYVAEVMKNSPAETAGLLSGDIIYSLNNQVLGGSSEFIEMVSQSAGVELQAKVVRESDTLNLAVIPGSDGKIGIAINDIFDGKFEYKTFGFFESFYVAGADLVNLTKLTFAVGSKVITGKVEFGKAFGGPVRIAQLAAKSADVGIESFLFFLAVLSLSLAIINILPLPVLDGGHLVMIIIETIARREIPVKVKIAINNTGFVLLLLLMVFILYNDILSL